MSSSPHRNSSVLVTGGAGFIGAATVRRLIQQGHRVTVADNGSGERHAAARLAAPEAEWIDVDLHDVDLAALMSGFSHVVHLAGRPGVQTSWSGGFVDHLRDNVLLTQRLLEAAIVTGPQRVLLASSSSVYGDLPTGLATEAAPLNPISPYGVSKAATEMLMAAYVERGVPAAALRFFTVYGRGQRPDMALHLIIDAALGGPAFALRGTGYQERDFTHVDDVAAAIEVAVGAPLPPGAVINIGSGRPTEVLTLISVVERQLGRRVPVVEVAAADGDPTRTGADNSRARSLLGWSPSTTLEAGVADQIAHQLRHTSDHPVPPSINPSTENSTCTPEPGFV